MKRHRSPSATTERLLDTAERLFARRGFDGVGMRALADEAGVNLGATTYHYGSKEKLYIETFMRRFRPANAERLELLRKAEVAAKGRPLSVETIVDCMLRPPFMTVLAHPNFPALLARSLFMPPPCLEEVLKREHEPGIPFFIAALAKALPKLQPEVLQMRVMFAEGALLMFSNQMSGLPLRGNPAFCEFALDALVRFIAAGLRAESSIFGEDFPPLPFSLRPAHA